MLNLKHYKYPTLRRKQKTWVKYVVIIVVILFSMFFLIRDNLKVTVDEVEVFNKQVPQSFDGFKILQISDVAESEWGEHQSRLIDEINKLQFDIIIFTGDYLRNPESTNYGPTIDILDHLPKDKPIYYIVGERDYKTNQKNKSAQYEINTTEKNEIMKQMDTAGAIYIYPIQKITKGDDYIYLTGIDYKEKLFDQMDFNTDQDFTITVIHRPIDYDVTKRLESINVKNLLEIDYDLSIAGHTLGGQYRIPLLGAFYAEGRGVFPKDNYIEGLSSDSKGRQNYISTGIGTSGPPIRSFRLFNSPEISLITLRTQK